MRVGIFIVWVFVIVWGCGSTKNKFEYLQSVDQEKQYVFEDSSTINVRVEYKPSQYMALLDLGDTFSQAMFTERMKDFEQSVYFVIKLSDNSGENLFVKGLKSQVEYNQRMNYYSHYFDQDFFVVAENSEAQIRPIITEMQRDFGNGYWIKILVGFSRSSLDNLGSKIKIHYVDRVFDYGKVHEIEFDKNILNIKQPKLEL